MICIVILCCTIFNFSAQEGQASSGTSSKVASFLIDTFAKGKEMSPQEKEAQIEILQPFVRKGAHFSIYMSLGILLMSCAQTFKGSKAYKFDFSAMFCFAYACTDELHQRFIPRKKWRICRCMLGYGRSNLWSFSSYANYTYRAQNKT